MDAMLSHIHQLFDLPPFLPIMAAGLVWLLLPQQRGRLLRICLPLLCALVGIGMWALWDTASMPVSLAAMDLEFFSLQHFSRIFATAFLITLGIGAVYGFATASNKELGWAYLYGGGALGVLFAGDLLTLFLFWEVMAIASTFVLLSQDSAAARNAALRYAVMHFAGGVLLLIGVAGLTALNDGTPVPVQSLTLHLLQGEGMLQFSAICVLLGILVNIAAPPFSAWLADSYPEASPSGSVFLSAFTTKTAVFVLLTLFPGTFFLTYIGLFMVFYGIIWAILENDMRRILSYSIINQVGFMVTGVGIGTPLALLGVAAHAFCHIIYKALLLMSAGTVLHVTGERKCSQLGGLYRRMWFTMICGTVGALAISAFPFTSGFVSKSLISQSAADAQLLWIWLLLIAASGGVFLHAGIKFPWFVFFQHKDTGTERLNSPISMRIAMAVLVALCILPGLFPKALYSMLQDTGIMHLAMAYKPYTSYHIMYQLELLCFSGVVFFLMLGWLKRTETISLDWDWFYRRLLPALWPAIIFVPKLGYSLYERVITSFGNVGAVQLDQYFGTKGALSRSWSLCNIALITVALLGSMLLLYYLS